MLDATRIWGYPSSSEPFNFKNADVNLDGKIDDFDYIYILNKVYYNWELPHTCGNYYTDIEIINTEQHKTILSCSCKGEILTIARNHEYINGECICGSKIVYGDVNNDGSIDMDDVTLLTEMLEGKAVDINELAADVFLDDDIEEFDRDLLLKYVKKEYNGELPHTCEGYTWKKETKVDDVQHKLVYRCDCGEIKSLTVYAEHVFEDGECVCGYKEVKEIILGDINNDGKVNLVDYEELEKYVKGGSNGKTYNLNNADVNLDGNIDIYDVYLIRISKYTGWPNGIELPHQCSNFMQEYEIIDNNKHLKVISCQCKTLMYKISYQHKFKNGKCVCGALESVDIKDIKVGDYIKYSANGYNEWRVLYNNDGQIDIVSVGSVGDFTLEGNGSYLKAVSELNAFANKFKTGLAISARSIGCTATSTATVSSGKWDMTGSPYEDRLYEKDINQLKNNGLVQSDKEVWLASRAIEGVLGGTAGKVRTLLANGSTNSHKLQSYTLFGQTDRKSKTFGFRPVISLPANLIVVAGDGKTLDTAFELSK